MILKTYLRPAQPRLQSVTFDELIVAAQLTAGRGRLLALQITANTSAPATFVSLMDADTLPRAIPGASKTAVVAAGQLEPGSLQTAAPGAVDCGGYTVQENDRVLITGFAGQETSQSSAGIYVMGAQGFSTATDADAAAEWATAWKVSDGSTTYVWTPPRNFVFGTDPITFQTAAQVQAILDDAIIGAPLYLASGVGYHPFEFRPGLLFEKGLALRFATDWQGYNEAATAYWAVSAQIEL